MKLTQRLYESAKYIWQGYTAQSFVKGIGEGTLEIDKFRFYMVQDYLYLLDYSKVFALGIVKSKEEWLMRKFADMVNGTLNSEMKVHKNYMARLGITQEEISKAKMSLINKSYTAYMLSVGHNEGVLEILVSILSCSWSYQEIGKALNAIPGAARHPFYGQWIQGYASEEYEKDNKHILELVDSLGEGCTEKEYQRLEEIFINCSRYEAMFWDMAQKKEM